MGVTCAQLKETLERIRETPILVVGDIILDRYIWGAAERISPEAPVPVIDVRRTEDRLGGAANVALNLAKIGAKPSISGFIGDDDEGRILLARLREAGIRSEGVVVDRERPTTVKTRVIASHQQVVRIDRELRARPSAQLEEALAAMVDSELDRHQGVVISDYGKGSIGAVMARRLRAASEAKRVSLDTRPLLLDPHPQNYDLPLPANVVKLNRAEAETASGVRIFNPETAGQAAYKLIERWGPELVMVTLGEGGLVIVEAKSDRVLHLPTEAREVFDVSGAGDTVAALLTAALSVHATPEAAGIFANLGAGIVVAEVGTVPVSEEKLLERIGAYRERA